MSEELSALIATVPESERPDKMCFALWALSCSAKQRARLFTLPWVAAFFEAVLRVYAEHPDVAGYRSLVAQPDRYPDIEGKRGRKSFEGLMVRYLRFKKNLDGTAIEGTVVLPPATACHSTVVSRRSSPSNESPLPPASLTGYHHHPATQSFASAGAPGSSIQHPTVEWERNAIGDRPQLPVGQPDSGATAFQPHLPSINLNMDCLLASSSPASSTEAAVSPPTDTRFFGGAPRDDVVTLLQNGALWQLSAQFCAPILDHALQSDLQPCSCSYCCTTWFPFIVARYRILFSELSIRPRDLASFRLDDARLCAFLSGIDPTGFAILSRVFMNQKPFFLSVPPQADVQRARNAWRAFPRGHIPVAGHKRRSDEPLPAPLPPVVRHSQLFDQGPNWQAHVLAVDRQHLHQSPIAESTRQFAGAGAGASSFPLPPLTSSAFAWNRFGGRL